MRARSCSTIARSARLTAQLGRLGTAGSLPRQRVRAAGAILPARVGVTTQLARDRRGRATQPPSDRSHRLPLGPEQHDLLAFGKRQAAPFEMAAAAGADPAARRDPAPALLTVGPDLLRRVSDRLTPRQRAPEHVHHLGQHPFAEHNHSQPSQLVKRWWGQPASGRPRAHTSRGVSIIGGSHRGRPRNQRQNARTGLPRGSFPAFEPFVRTRAMNARAGHTRPRARKINGVVDNPSGYQQLNDQLPTTTSTSPDQNWVLRSPRGTKKGQRTPKMDAGCRLCPEGEAAGAGIVGADWAVRLD